MAYDVVCPECREPVQAGWKYCPNCQLALIALPAAREVPPARRRRRESERADSEREEEAGFDTRWIGFGLVLLAVMGGFTGLMVMMSTPVRGWNLEAFFIVGFGVVIVATVGIVLSLRGRSGTAVGVASGALGGVAIGCMGAALAVLAVLSMIVFAIQDCLRTCGGGR